MNYRERKKRSGGLGGKAPQRNFFAAAKKGKG